MSAYLASACGAETCRIRSKAIPSPSLLPTLSLPFPQRLPSTRLTSAPELQMEAEQCVQSSQVNIFDWSGSLHGECLACFFFCLWGLLQKRRLIREPLRVRCRTPLVQFL